MATTYTSAGTPSDATGIDGDVNWDYVNRIYWGPKGLVTPGSWTGTSYSNIGPTGPAQLSGTTAPASGLGNPGQGYTNQANGDTYIKDASGTWNKVGSNLGPQGVAGPTTGNRLQVKSYVWGSATAGSAYSNSVAINITSGTQSYSFIPLVEPMLSAGTIIGVTSWCPGNVANSTATVNVLKNNASLYTTGAYLTCSSTVGNTTSAISRPSSTISFASGDIITLTTVMSASGSMCVYTTLYYTHTV